MKTWEAIAIVAGIQKKAAELARYRRAAFKSESPEWEADEVAQREAEAEALHVVLDMAMEKR